MGTGNVTDIPVAGVTSVYTEAIPIHYGSFFAVAYKANSALFSSISVTIVAEQSWTKPATEFAADSNYFTPVGMPDIVTTLTTENTWYGTSIALIPFGFLRFKISGTGSNAADTLVNMKLSVVEEF